jgi:flagellar biosynthesis/type III secretory pathway M-ring protein FliF/YscJ
VIDPVSIVILTAAVLGVLLVVLAIIAVVVLTPAVRRSLAERAQTTDDGESAQGLENDDRGGR